MRSSDWDPSDRVEIRDGAGNLIRSHSNRGSSVRVAGRDYIETYNGIDSPVTRFPRIEPVRPATEVAARIERNRQRVWWFFRRWALHWMLWMTYFVAVGQQTDAASVAAVILVSAVVGAWSVGMVRLGYLAGRNRLWR